MALSWPEERKAPTVCQRNNGRSRASTQASAIPSCSPRCGRRCAGCIFTNSCLSFFRSGSGRAASSFCSHLASREICCSRARPRHGRQRSGFRNRFFLGRVKQRSDDASENKRRRRRSTSRSGVKPATACGSKRTQHAWWVEVGRGQQRRKGRGATDVGC